MAASSTRFTSHRSEGCCRTRSNGKTSDSDGYGALDMTKAKRRVLPGFGLTMGYTLAYLSLIALIPLSTILLKTYGMGWERFWHVVTAPRVMAAYKLSIGASLIAAAINSIFGFIVAWTLSRYDFPGKGALDALVDLPFALPTSVAGITLTSIYAQNGIIGRMLVPLGIKVAFTPLGIVVALTFIGLPFVVRTVQPVLEDIDKELEEASASLGATRWTTIRRVLFPSILPALLTGFSLAFARAVGEYGSVIFIAGNLPNVSEIAPLLIVIRLQEFRYADATAIAVVMLVASFLIIFAVNRLQRFAQTRIPAH